MHRATKANIVINSVQEASMEMTVKQGMCLSPVLFIIYRFPLMRGWRFVSVFSSLLGYKLRGNFRSPSKFSDSRSTTYRSRL